ncbi:protein AGENET DOMAIN (AGD)-CONTAINING P1-like [Gossypium arboreum]|uniref:Protein AGENET DOMAIN (AGD)-CONTAINING P1-like n=1 Tax=Gossypium hirsutum TaxID=3635 RepID=A0ABM2ZIU5_GOSHI|nr:protein AGENET DOMAIN (AGD)-CONTAINING P1-like [Gossypium hirsutum]XP_052880025.1 protein AGENET DOMAIN (AGD)-CONTAINING P1-like [Gossypium arboreum]
MVVFFEGDEVKVCSKEEGFLLLGSYYEAKILPPYKNIVEEEDQTSPLVEIVSTDEVRPMPPPATITRATQVFHYLDRVDAFDNDGWWVGILFLLL